MNIHAVLEGLIDRWERWQDKRFRAALRRQNRKRRARANSGVIYVDSKPDPKTVVHNERDITR